MKYIKLASLIGLFSILLFSCSSKKSKLGKMIPKEAALVVDINTKSLLSKLSWEEIKQTYWYNELMADTSIPATSKTILGDPAKSGIDLESDIVLFVLKQGNAGQVVVEGSLKDSKTFSDFLKSMQPAGAVASKDGELNLLKSDEAVIGWKNEKFVVVTSSNHDKMQDELWKDSLTVKVPTPPTSPDSLLKICKNVFSLNDDNSLYENERFAALEEEEGDVHFWVNTAELTRGSVENLPGMGGMVKLDQFLDQNISTATINFQDGKVTVNQKQYFGKELSDILKKGEGDLNTDMIKRLPSQNLAGVFAMHFTPGSLLEIIKLTGLDGFINLFLSAQGLSLEDAIKATKGDIVFALSDIIVKDDTAKVKVADTAGKFPQKPGATFLFAVAIGDKDAFNKLIGVGKKMGKDMSDNKSTVSKTDDKYFAVSNSQEAVNKYFSGTQAEPGFLSTIKDHPTGGFVDIQMILKALKAEFTKDSLGTSHYNRNIALWNNIYFKGGDYKDGGLANYAELNLVDKTTNSLKQLNKFVDENAKIMIEKRKKQKEEWKTDGLQKAKTDSLAVNKKKGSKKRK